MSELTEPMCDAGVLRKERCLACTCREPDCQACGDSGYEAISTGGYELVPCDCTEPNNQTEKPNDQIP